ncbi:MAG TPA: right-handed parallel beta-helix repeat-containing protein [archaeon]|nr:right-handed parallel beta-helix repeat-containing protein [archaeon]
MRKSIIRTFFSTRTALSLLALCLALTVPLKGRMLFLSTAGDDSADCVNGAAFRTLKRAAGCLRGGDTLLVRKGIYSGGVTISVSAAREAPVLIQGESLEAIISGSGEERDAICIDHAGYITIDRLTVREAKRAGVGVLHSHHIRITRGRFADNGTWGIFTGFADDIYFGGNECCGSKKQHGIYHSNSGDRFVICGNLVHDNNMCGIHLNGDPEIKGGDGVLNYGLVEGNIIYGNGAAGGAAINMTHVQDALVRNNLIYNNYAGGFTVYQDTGTFDQGSKRVVILGNTVYFQPDRGRSGANIQTTSEKVLIAGNIFVSGGRRGTLEVNSDHLETVTSDHNIFWGVKPEEMIERKERKMGMDDWRSLTGNDLHSRTADPQFVDLQRGDLNIAPTSPAINAGMPLDSVRAVLARLGGFEWILARLDSLPDEDIRKKPRPAGSLPDAGAYERDE